MPYLGVSLLGETCTHETNGIGFTRLSRGRRLEFSPCHQTCLLPSPTYPPPFPPQIVVLFCPLTPMYLGWLASPEPLPHVRSLEPPLWGWQCTTLCSANVPFATAIGLSLLAESSICEQIGPLGLGHLLSQTAISF